MLTITLHKKISSKIQSPTHVQVRSGLKLTSHHRRPLDEEHESNIIILFLHEFQVRKGGGSYGAQGHFQQYFSFIGGGNWSIWRKPPICRKSLTNFIT